MKGGVLKTKAPLYGEQGLIIDDTMWDDLRVPITAVRLAGVNDPDFENYKDGIYLYSFGDEAVNEEQVFFAVQIPHSWKTGTSIEPHIHWIPEDATAGNVRFALEYSIADISGAFGATTTIYKDCPAPGVADTHTYCDLGSIDMSSYTGLSPMLICRLFRNSSNANDTFDGKKAWLCEIDFHFEMDTLGSKEELTK